jgi:hypothetical protein
VTPEATFPGNKENEDGNRFGLWSSQGMGSAETAPQNADLTNVKEGIVRQDADSDRFCLRLPMQNFSWKPTTKAG